MRPACACGWVSNRVLTRPERLQVAFDQHARTKGCGKVRFAEEAAARRALVDARIAADLHDVRHRREQRAYLCTDGCPDGTWHLSSQAARSASR